jgi:hypothetical protein
MPTRRYEEKMIEEVLEVIKEDLDTFLRLKMKEGQEKYVKLAPLIDQEGKSSLNENAICMSVVKIESDRTNISDSGYHEVVGSETFFFNGPIKLNLYILFSATYIDGQEKNYQEALKRLSHVIAFFQAKNVFTAKNTPKLSVKYEPIIMEFFNQSFEEEYNLWGMLGNNYRPSVLYKLRALMIEEEQIAAVGEPARDIEVEMGIKE